MQPCSPLHCGGMVDFNVESLVRVAIGPKLPIRASVIIHQLYFSAVRNELNPCDETFSE